MSENDRTDRYDSACRDSRDNCPTEGAVLQREWRQKTTTIAVLDTMVVKLGVSSTELREALRDIYIALRNRHHGRMPDDVQTAYDKAGELLRRHQPDVEEQAPACSQDPDAPHGFNRNASHSLGRYVCDCEGFDAARGTT